MDPTLDTFADRCWYAWQCGPRGEKGLPAPWRTIEQEHRLPESVLSGVFSGRRKAVSTLTAVRLATALNVSLDWLMRGIGEPPTLTGEYKPRLETPDDRKQSKRIQAYLIRLGFPRDRVREAVRVLLPSLSEVD